MPLIEYISKGGDLKDEPLNAFVSWAVGNGRISTEPMEGEESCPFLEGCIEEAGTDLEKVERLERMQRRVQKLLPSIRGLHNSKLDHSKSKSGKSRSFSQTGFEDKKEGTDTGLKTQRVTSPDKV